MTLEEAMNLANNNLNSLSGQQAKDVLRTLTRETQSRYRDPGIRFAPARAKITKQFGYKAPTFKRGLTSDGQFRHYIRINKEFLQAQTSTPQGFAEFERGISNTFGQMTGGIYYEDLTKTQKRNFWEFYNSLSESGANWTMLDSEQRGQLITEFLFQRGNKEDRMVRMSNRLQELADIQRTEYSTIPMF